MRTRFRSLPLIATMVVCLAGATRAQVAVEKYKELPNFHQVNVQLYRGGQPRRGGTARLTRLGIKTVINLRDDDEHARVEEREVRAAGLNYFNVPLDTLGRPSDAKVERVLAIINAPENQPVFVHCRRGKERTGTIIAIYRIVHDGWTSEAAQREANRYGMLFLRFDLRDYIRDYYKRRIERTSRVPASDYFL